MFTLNISDDDWITVSSSSSALDTRLTRSLSLYIHHRTCSQRILKAREPKILEGAKNALLLKGTKCPDMVQTVLGDLVRDCMMD